VPLVVRQNKERTEHYGILFSRGYVSHECKKLGNRHKVENVHKQTFLGFVSTLPELEHHGWTTGNSIHK
jgi:hypothetical protein